MKNSFSLLSLILCSILYCQAYSVSKTEVLVNYDENRWSQTTENVFIKSVTLIGNSIEVTLPNDEVQLIYKMEVELKRDKDNNKVMTFYPNLIRGKNSVIELTIINDKPAFAYGSSVGWDLSQPNKIEMFRLYF